MVMIEHLMEEHIQGDTWLLYNRKTVCTEEADRIDREEKDVQQIYYICCMTPSGSVKLCKELRKK